MGFVTKPFKSVVDKIYRSNVLYNRQYPLPPKTGLLEPPRLYEQIEDLIRTRLVCKYMDGPRFVCDALKQLCEKGGISNKVREHSNEAGYYAWHFYVSIPVELMLEGTVVQRNVWVEIQITTQLAEVITALTHELYETRRSAGLVPKSTDWKWEAASKEFRSAYLGHGLHLLEGIIQNLKDDVVLPSLDGGDRSQHASSLPVRVDPQSPTRADELPMRGEKDN
ncbi:hypothetical protein [Bradyrhizobium sp. SZCCHNRI1073]|uniref:hypothetical protein n=1 Tax=Bradyrhizobium sp. SZCCHNRI1073 TaxID=3057280 RepID=UPI002915F9F6|nr:hypothetical protein [Bradyrhizobium sp. SZCCHNRI1073]